MTTGPCDGKCANPADGPGGMPLALRLSEWLGLVERLRRWPDLPGMNLDRDLMCEAADEIDRLRAKVERLELYENLAKEFGLSAFPDCAAWQQTLEAIAEGRVMPRDGTHTHAEAVAAYQALARQALAGADHFGDANKMVLGPNAE